MLGLFGILLALGALIFFAYRGYSVLYLAPITALIAALFAGAPLIATYTQIFMPAMGKYVITYFPVFLLGAVFGKLMSDTGYARAIAMWIVDKVGAKRALLATILSGGVLTYGGVSIFVVAFGLFPIAAQLFKAADIPKRLVPATMFVGTATFTMTALPGTPSIQNAIPGPFFGTNTFAAPGLGIIAGIIMGTLGYLWVSRQAKKARARGEGYAESDTAAGFGEDPLKYERKKAAAGSAAGGAAAGAGVDGAAADIAAQTESAVGASATETAEKPAVEEPLPNAALAFLPIILVIAINFTLVTWVFPAMNTEYLAQESYGKTDIKTVGGIWAIVIALFMACLVTGLTGLKRLKDHRASLNAGASGSMLPIFNTASEVGFGSVIASVPAFSLVRDAVLSIPGNPLVSLAVAANVLAGITGSASGGLSIALNTLGAEYNALAAEMGINPELMHRVSALASGGMDSLPHNGAVITLLTICGLTHRQSYKDIGIVTVLIPIVGVIAVIVLGSIFGSF